MTKVCLVRTRRELTSCCGLRFPCGLSRNTFRFGISARSPIPRELFSYDRGPSRSYSWSAFSRSPRQALFRCAFHKDLAARMRRHASLNKGFPFKSLRIDFVLLRWHGCIRHPLIRRQFRSHIESVPHPTAGRIWKPTPGRSRS